MTAGGGDGGSAERPASRATATMPGRDVDATSAGPRAVLAAEGKSPTVAGGGGGGRRGSRRPVSSPRRKKDGVESGEEGAAAAAPAPRPLVAPTPGVRLLAAVLLALLIGTAGGGLAAWAIYLHLGPVQRPVTGAPGTKGGQATASVGQLAAAAAPSLVAIATQPVSTQSLTQGSTGFVSGVIVSSDGLILTSAHAIAGATQLRVGLPDGKSYNATIAATDTAHGLALLRIAGVSGLTALPLASTAPAVGDSVLVVDDPPEVGLSVGVGTVAAVNERIMSDSATGLALIGVATIDATSEPEADGAPVLDSAGQLAGIVSGVSQASAPPGITMLSIDAARALILSGSGGSAGPAGTFGLETAFLDPAHAAAAGLTSGALVISVVPEGPAAAAGLRPGDVVTSVNGQAIDSATALDPTKLGLAPGDTAALTAKRGRATLTLTLTVGSAP